MVTKILTMQDVLMIEEVFQSMSSLWDQELLNGAQKKKPITALLSTEAEYVVVAFAACQVVWLRGILSDLQQQ